MSDSAHLILLLIKPSKYDDDGYVVRHWRGVLPSNTLNCLYALTGEAIQSGALGDVRVSVHVFDETVDTVDPRRLMRRYGRRGARVLAALAGVQTNQFPRAQDLARAFRGLGADVMIGGFHVSGAMALAEDTPPECQAMIDEGVTLVLGEVEEHWAGLLRDAAAGALQPVYDYLDHLPPLSQHAIPMPSDRLQRRFALRGSATVDMSRGCPFRCTFCTIISVQGRTMRARDPERVLAQIRSNADSRRINHYFFTDDNFARSPAWEAIFDGLIALREAGQRIDFMMQVDIAAAKLPRFIEKAARAGCVQVFIGMESIRPDNLERAGKRQNKVEGYRAAIQRWHDAGIVCHVGYIIGFPFDTYERVMEDVRALRDELLVDQASFFMLTPLPGSQDHVAAVAAGVPLDSDYNRFDSFHATQPHPLMSDEVWFRAFRDAWREFYDFDHMVRALLRQNPHTYWGLFKNFLWYRAAMIEGAHPMITGFFRRKRRVERRPTMPIEPRLVFWRRRAREMGTMAVGYTRLLFEMHELWKRTRIRRADYRGWPDLPVLRGASAIPLAVKMQWARLHVDRAAAWLAAGRVAPGVLRQRLEEMWSSWQDGQTAVPAAPAARREVRPPVNVVRLAWCAARDARQLLAFLFAAATERY
jgi:radical SAM superfamily enzyme YgiQ (UPF0313 family)